MKYAQKLVIVIVMLVELGCTGPTSITIDWYQRFLVPALPPSDYYDATNMIYALIYSYLALPTSEGGLQSDLAERWVYNPDLLMWRIYLRKAKWHDGSPVLASDVALSILRYANTNNAIAIDVIMPWRDQVIIKLKNSDPWLMHRLSKMEVVPPDEEVWKGSGPYRFNSITKDVLTLKANPYWYGRSPKIDQVKLQHVPAHLRSAERIEKRETDLLFDMPFTEIANSASIRTSYRLMPYYIALLFHPCATHAVVMDRDLRRIISMVVDKQRLIDTAYEGHAHPVNSVVGVQSPYGKESTAPETDIVAAIQSLEVLGYERSTENGIFSKDGQPLELSVCVFGDQQVQHAGGVLKSDLISFGIAAEISIVESLKDVAHCNVILTRIGGAYGPTPDDWLSFWTTENKVLCYRNPRLEILGRLIRMIDKPEARSDIVHEIDRILMDESIIIPLAQPITMDLTSARLSEPIQFGHYGIRRLAEAYWSHK